VFRLWKFVALVLAVVWPLAVCHCAIEELLPHPVLACSADKCCSAGSDPDSSTPAPDVCDLVEFSFYKTEKAGLNIPAPAQMTALLPAKDEANQARVAFIARSGVAPPELIVSRHFLSRSAPSPRAPSGIC
jgi:hypothetical protein